MEAITLKSNSQIGEKLLGIKQSSKRSLALVVVGILTSYLGVEKSQASDIGWKFAEDVKSKHGDDFTSENALDEFENRFINSTTGEIDVSKTRSSDSVDTKPSTSKPIRATAISATRNGKIDFTPEHLKYMEDESIIKNGRIRYAIKHGYSYTAIANLLDIGYQQVKNVQKKQVDSEIVDALSSGASVSSLKSKYSNIQQERWDRLKLISQKRKKTK